MEKQLKLFGLYFEIPPNEEPTDRYMGMDPQLKEIHLKIIETFEKIIKNSSK